MSKVFITLQPGGKPECMEFVEWRPDRRAFFAIPRGGEPRIVMLTLPSLKWVKVSRDEGAIWTAETVPECAPVQITPCSLDDLCRRVEFLEWINERAVVYATIHDMVAQETRTGFISPRVHAGEARFAHLCRTIKFRMEFENDSCTYLIGLTSRRATKAETRDIRHIPAAVSERARKAGRRKATVDHEGDRAKIRAAVKHEVTTGGVSEIGACETVLNAVKKLKCNPLGLAKQAEYAGQMDKYKVRTIYRASW